MLGVTLFSRAGSSSAGSVSRLEFINNGKVLFHHDGRRTGAPSCVGTNFQRRWVIDASSESGKVQLSGLLLAYTADKKITIIGQGECSLWGDTETVNYFYTLD